MPQLPSGLHIGADPAPLRELLRGAASGFNAHHIMALDSPAALLGWLHLLTLKPDADLTPEERAIALEPDTNTPTGLIALPTGRRLKDWQELADAQRWSADDREAMETFVRERVMPAMERLHATTVRDCQAALTSSPTAAGALACMWRDGVHPLQAEPE